MFNLLLIQIVSGVAIALFYSVYRLFFKKETFFKMNRYVLISALIIAFAVPFIKIPTSDPAIEKIQKVNLINTFQESEHTTLKDAPINQSHIETNGATNNSFNWKELIGTLYFIGLAGFSFKIGLDYEEIKRLKKNSKYNAWGYYEVSSELGSFSFFDSIFISSNLSESEKRTIWRHESEHVYQNHSIDVIIFAIAKAFQWFNPYIYMMEKEIKEVHEYLADRNSSEDSKTEYIELLINQSIGARLIDLGNNFNSSTLLNRLKMLQKSKSKPIKALKYALALLPAALCLVLFSCKTPPKERFSIPIDDHSTPCKQDVDSAGRPAPIIGWKAFHELINNEIKMPKEALDSGIAAQIFLSYEIDTLGNMVNLKYENGKRTGGVWTQEGVGFGIDEEAIRVGKVVCEKVKWKPAIKNGRPTVYSLSMDMILGDKRKFEMYQISPEVLFTAHVQNSDKIFRLQITNPCICKANEPSFFLNNNFNQIYSSVGFFADTLLKRDSGSVEVSFAIDKYGSAIDVKIEKASGKFLDKIALEAVQQLNNMVVEGFHHENKRYTIPIIFTTGLTKEEADKIDYRGYTPPKSN